MTATTAAVVATTSDTLTGWYAHGACLGVHPDLFHPDRGASTADAKATCAACPVRVDCLEWALATHQKFGIWGGTSERERRRIRRRLLAGQAVPELERPTSEPEEEGSVDLDIAPADLPAPITNGARTDTCANCGIRYIPSRKDQRFHSKECARAWYGAHPRTETGERKPRVRRPKAVEVPVTRKAPAPAIAPGPGPVDLQVLLGQLLAGSTRWHVEADVGDIHLTVTRDVT